MKHLISCIFMLALSIPVSAADCVAVVYDDPADPSGISVRNVAWNDLAALESELDYLRLAVQHVDDATGYTLTDNLGPSAQAGLDTLSPLGLHVLEQVPKEDDANVPAKDRGWRSTFRTVGAPTIQTPLRAELWGAHTSGSQVVLLHKHWQDADYDSQIDAASTADLGSCAP